MSPLTADEAAARLGVKVATVYAYVSRGVLRSWQRPGTRASLFDPEEVEVLARRGRPRRASRPPALDFVIHTTLTTVTDHDVRYRGVSALDLARTATFEEVAGFLWTGERHPASAPWRPLPVAVPALPAGRDRLRMAVVLSSAFDPWRADLATPAVAERGRSLVATMVDAVAGDGGDRAARLALPAGGPLRRGTIAGRLWTRLTSMRPSPSLVGALNAALVLLADHELAVSTVAARVAASARADPYAVVLAGLGPLAGSLHGGAAHLAFQLLESAADRGAHVAITRVVESHQHVPGFGHRLYRDADPRGRLLMELIRSARPTSPALEVADRVITVVRERAQLEPNVDLALAVLARAASMGEDAPEVIFTIARAAGWIAHAIEEYGEDPLRFRARAVARR